MRKLDKVMLGAAIAGILSGAMAGPVSAADKKSDDVACWGVNACKGKGSCGGKEADHGCGGKNACKGKGWVQVTKEVCDQLGGTANPLPDMK